jgi:NAD(P)-dependent dehydrogenase (short-subunit alcohol dehydrogenase family)
MDKRLKILITGGTRDLGRKIAEYMIRQGHEVYIIGKTAKKEIDQPYLSVLKGYIECDMSNIMQIKEAIGILIDKAGKIDVLVNNAAVRNFKMLEEFQTDEIQYNINVDFVAPVILTNLCLPVMKRNNFGRIINISSISAFKVYNTGTLYCSSKRALITFSETLSKELAGLNGAVTVNTVCPDSFSRIDGTGLINYHQTTELILNHIQNIINSESNGMEISVFTFKHKIRERLRLIKKALFMS